ncbi:hypothetical protein B5F35_04080 [Anaeromassilibacillus sp. An200]|nr:hypothetical protein B5F35_04080 [Anaeromassilibacillus sp. An200]
MAVLQNNDAVRTAHKIHITERKERFLFFLIQNSPAIPYGWLVRVRTVRTRRIYVIPPAAAGVQKRPIGRGKRIFS